MQPSIKYLFSSLVLLSSMNGFAEDQPSQTTPNKQILTKQEAAKLSNLSQIQTGKAKPLIDSEKSSFKSFTGKVLGSNVRLRAQPDVDSSIVRELEKDELLVITGEKNDFYTVQPPQDIKAYVFRSFVLDNIVEANRVNVRLSPETDAPVIATLNSGERVEGKISEKNPKWLEIVPPSSSCFYIAKEFVESIGGPEVKPIQDKRKETVSKLMETALFSSQSEMSKPFEEIDLDRISAKFKTILTEYQDFPDYVAKASAKLAALQEAYLQKKLIYLENRTNMLSRELTNEKILHTPSKKISAEAIPVSTGSPTDRMKVWEPLEQALFLSWSAINHAKNMDDFYSDQKSKAVTIQGFIDNYGDPVKNKPGDYVLKERDVPVAYVYSTQVDLDQFVGKQVHLVAYPRPNNSFAFPAYYVFDVCQ